MTTLLADTTPRNGVWTVPTVDAADDPHTIALGHWLGCRRPDGSPSPELLVSFSSGVGILTPDEARVLASTLLSAADFADACMVGGQDDVS